MLLVDDTAPEVYVAEQVPCLESLQTPLAVNEPEAVLWKLTVPVGSVPVTVAVHLVVVPTTTEAWLQLTVVVEVGRIWCPL